MKILFAMLCFLAACEDPMPKGYNPATNRCQHFDPAKNKYVGEFLPDEECRNLPTPEAVG